MHGKRFKKSTEPVSKIFEKALKIKNCSKFIMAEILSRNQTYVQNCFSFLHISFAIHMIHRNFKKIDISFSITDLVRTTFMLYLFSFFWCIVFMELSVTLKTHSTKLQPFSTTEVIFTSLRSREYWYNAN